MALRYDFHIHSLLTEGDLVPSEIVRRCSAMGFGGIAITDHVDRSNIAHVLGCLVPACKEMEEDFGIHVLPGVELTHVHPKRIGKLARSARELGAAIVAVHGETIVEPVLEGTTKAALQVPEVDFIAHPGLITLEEASLAAEMGIFLELSSRKGHSLANGHVAKTAMAAGAGLILNSDAHSPGDLIDYDESVKVALGCGVEREMIEEVLVKNPLSLINKRS